MPNIASFGSKMLNFGYSLTQEMTDGFMIHCHSIYEIYYFIEGDADYLVEGKQYHLTPHSLLLLSPHTFHGVRVNSCTPYRRFTIHFNPDLLHIEQRNLLLSAFPNNKKNSQKEVFYESTDAYRLYSYFESFVDCCKQPNDISIQLLPIYTEALLAGLTIMYQTLHPTIAVETISHTITDIITYLNAHLTEHITLDNLSKQFFISKHYLNRIFRKATGTTVCNFLIYKRVIYAQQLLLNGCYANEAAVRSGFSDYSSFYRAYKKVTNHSPVSDRREIPRQQ